MKNIKYLSVIAAVAVCMRMLGCAKNDNSNSTANNANKTANTNANGSTNTNARPDTTETDRIVSHTYGCL